MERRLSLWTPKLWVWCGFKNRSGVGIFLLTRLAVRSPFFEWIDTVSFFELNNESLFKIPWHDPLKLHWRRTLT